MCKFDLQMPTTRCARTHAQWPPALEEFFKIALAFNVKLRSLPGNLACGLVGVTFEEIQLMYLVGPGDAPSIFYIFFKFFYHCLLTFAVDLPCWPSGSSLRPQPACDVCCYMWPPASQVPSSLFSLFTKFVIDCHHFYIRVHKRLACRSTHSMNSHTRTCMNSHTHNTHTQARTCRRPRAHTHLHALAYTRAYTHAHAHAHAHTTAMSE